MASEQWEDHIEERGRSEGVSEGIADINKIKNQNEDMSLRGWHGYDRLICQARTHTQTHIHIYTTTTTILTLAVHFHFFILLGRILKKEEEEEETW